MNKPLFTLIIIFLLCFTSLFAQENKQNQYDQVNPFEQFLGKGVAAYGSLAPRLLITGAI